MATTAPGAVYVVTGASRGLGLEFVRQLLASDDGKNTVVAAARNVSSAPQLLSLDDGSGRLHIVQLDVADGSSIKTAAESITQLVGHVDVLINNAGIGDSNALRWDETDVSDFRTVLDANLLGPLLVTSALLPALQKGSRKLVANVSSIMGSLGFTAKGLAAELSRPARPNTRGPPSLATGFVGYRVSKAALNMLTLNIAHDLSSEGFTVVTLHPGWVSTDMGNRAASEEVKPPLTPEQSVSGVLRVLGTLTPADTGSFRDWNGDTVEW